MISSNSIDAPALGRAFAPQQSGARARRSDFEREFEIVVDGLALEHGRLLEFPPDAKLGDLGLVEAGEIVGAVEHDVAEIRPGLAGDHIHHGGLAGAVRADDGAHLAGLDRERQIVERLEAVERDGDAVEIKQRGGERFHRLSIAYSAGSGSAHAVFGGGRGAIAAQRIPMPHRADDAARQQQRHGDEQRAEHEQPIGREESRREERLGVIHQHRADHRAGERAAAADRDPDHGLDGIGRARIRSD